MERNETEGRASKTEEREAVHHSSALSLSSLDPPHASLHTSLSLSVRLCLSTTAPRSLKESPPLCDVTIAEREREIKDEDEEEEGGIEKFGGVNSANTHTYSG